MNKKQEQRLKNYKPKYCKFCGKNVTSIDQFCNDECEKKWKRKKETKNDRGGLSCMYGGCRSDLPVTLAGRYCSEFCKNHQDNINKKKNSELEKCNKKILKDIEKIKFDSEELKHEEIKKRKDLAIKEVDNLVFDMPIYIGNMEQASNLFGIVDVPRTQRNSVSGKK